METYNLDPRSERILPWLVAVGFFMETLDGTILNTALPSMAKSLGAHPLQMQAVVISYFMTVALLIPASGWLTDRFSIRRVYLFAIVVFTLGSIMCALSMSLPMLVGCRIIQGIGGALLMPVGRLSVLRSYPRDKLVEVMNFVTIPGLLGPLLGPTLGGLIVSYASWHWAFLINIPIGVIGFIAAMRHMPDIPRPENVSRFDKWGFGLFTFALLLIITGLEGLGELHLPYVPMFSIIGVGILFLGFYFWYASKAERPIFSLSLFKTRNFSVGIAGNIFARLGQSSLPFLTPLYLQVGLGFPPLKSGLSMMPMTLAALLAKSVIPRVLKYFGYKRLLLVNTVVLGVVIASFSFLKADTSYAVIIPLFMFFGICNSVQFTCMNNLTLVDLSNDDAASGNSFFSAVMMLSMAMAVACASIILGEFTGLRGEGEVQTGIEAFHSTYVCLGAIAIASSCIFFMVGPTKDNH